MTACVCGECGHISDDGTPTDLTPLPERLTQLGADPALLKADLVHVITTAIDSHPRSLQVKVGPSEVGTPCSRRLGYKLLNVPPVNTDRGAAWKPTVGTAVHTWLQGALQAWNDSHAFERFYLEQRVTVGEIAGQPIDGSADVYDRVTGTVIDWKVVGLASLKRARVDGPGEQYRSQAHLYGRGFRRLGLPVERVAVVFLPQNGELADMHIWSEPYDEQVAVAALTRADGIASLTADLGTAALPLLPTADAFCSYCPWRLAAATDVTEACPGHSLNPASNPLAAEAAPAA